MRAWLTYAAWSVPLCTSSTYGEPSNGSIRETIRDGTNSETLPGANVQIDSLGTGGATDKFGYFILSGIPAGSHQLHFSFIGFETKSRSVRVTGGETARIEVELDPIVLEGEEIVATGRHVTPGEITTVGGFGTRVTELARLPSVGSPDLMRSVQLLPGVQAASDNSAGLYVRGGTPGQNLILLDDVVVYNPNHLFSTFNPDALKDVTLLKGTFPAKYGDRLSSVLDITNLDGNRKRFSTRASIDLISAGLTAEGPIGESGSWMVSGRRTYQEMLDSPLFSHIVDEIFSTRSGTITVAPYRRIGIRPGRRRVRRTFRQSPIQLRPDIE